MAARFLSDLRADQKAIEDRTSHDKQEIKKLEKSGSKAGTKVTKTEL